ncbi:MAG: hypothetical protein LH645_08730 [Actinomycetia bacterium]|nr:hypothetical protein [Actinomycetes bacterium]
MATVTEVVDVDTRHGLGRWYVDEPVGRTVANLAIGHGAGGGVESADLVVVAKAMAAAGFRVGRFEQPWRLAGRRVAGPPRQLDAAWCDALPDFASAQRPLIVGGRSAGARVACRTAVAAGASGVLALAFSLQPPGRPGGSRFAEIPALPVLVVQGDRDAFGGPNYVVQSGAGSSGLSVLPIPGADHALNVVKSGPITLAEAHEIITIGVRRWALAVVRGNLR